MSDAIVDLKWKHQDKEPLQPFYDYLEKRRQALLTELDAIERTLGVSPRTAEARKIGLRTIALQEHDNVAGVIAYDEN
jgi:hypothetical protein